MLDLTYEELKSLIDSGQVLFKVLENAQEYHIIGYDGPFQAQCFVQKGSAEATDYLASLATQGPASAQKKLSGGIAVVRQVAHPPGFATVLSGAGDGPNPLAVGGNGASLRWAHALLAPANESFYVDYNVVGNPTQLQNMAIGFQGAVNDEITIEVVPKLTSYNAGSGTPYKLAGDKIVPAANASGTIAVANPALRPIGLLRGGELGPADANNGHWNAQPDPASGTVINITPNFNVTGNFNMYASETVLAVIANRVSLLGEGVLHIEDLDALPLPINARIKVSTRTVGAAHAWQGNVNFTMFRRFTV